jgi:histidinol-phosphate aminotransferase
MTQADLVYRAGRSAAEIEEIYGLQDAVKLSSNELPWGPLPSVQEAIVQAVAGNNGVNRYPDIHATALRTAIAAHHHVTVEHIAVGAGSGGLLAQLVRACLDDGDDVLIPDPTFGLYRIMSSWTGASVRAVESVGTTANAAELIAQLRTETKLVFLASPNNPTATALGIDQLAQVLEAVPVGCTVVVDEAYADFVRASHVMQGKALISSFDNVAVLRTFSKAHGLAGLRIGYLLGRRRLVAQVSALSTPFHVSSMAQVAGVESLRRHGEVCARVDLIVAERERVSNAIRRLGLGLSQSQANFVWLPAGERSADLAQACERAGVVPRLFPGQGVRITIGLPHDNDRVLEVLRVPGLVEQLAPAWRLPTGEPARRSAELARPDRLDDSLADQCGRAYRDALERLGKPVHPSIDAWTAGQSFDALLAELLDTTDGEDFTVIETIVANIATAGRKRDQL